MKILLDENIPRKLKNDFDSHLDIKTVREMKWNGIKNGKLMQLIQNHNFNFFITVDKNLPFEQNLNSVPFSIFILRAPNNKRKTLTPLVAKILQKIVTKNYQKINEIYLESNI